MGNRKPRIKLGRMRSGERVWWCSLGGFVGNGPTPAAAYRAFESTVERLMRPNDILAQLKFVKA